MSFRCTESSDATTLKRTTGWNMPREFGGCLDQNVARKINVEGAESVVSMLLIVKMIGDWPPPTRSLGVELASWNASFMHHVGAMGSPCSPTDGQSVPKGCSHNFPW